MFISFEGIDGSGKTTQARSLYQYLIDTNRKVILTREPGGSPGAEEIRRLLVEGDPDRWSEETEILLFNAARKDHVEKTIWPAIKEGKVVLCDRFVDSTRAFQEAGNPELKGAINLLHDLMIGIMPDLTLIFDLDPKAAQSRFLGGHETRFEDKGLDFQTRVREIYLTIAIDESHRCKVIDASGTETEVFTQVQSAVENRLKS